MPIKEERFKVGGISEHDGESQIYFDEDLRFITLSGAISWKVADVFFNTLTAFEVKDPAKPVAIYINSEGGEVYAVWKTYDHMRHSRYPIITVAAGLVYSGGLMLFMAGDKRLMFPHAILRFHELWREHEGKEYPRDSAEADRHHQDMHKKIISLFRKRGAKMSLEMIKEYLHIQRRVDAKTARKLGLAHKIINPRQKHLLKLNAHQKNLLGLDETH